MTSSETCAYQFTRILSIQGIEGPFFCGLPKEIHDEEQCGHAFVPRPKEAEP